MKKIILCIGALFLTTSVSAQIQQLKEWATQPRILEKADARDIDGSPFYNEDWETGYVIIDENSKSNVVELKYSSYTNEVLYIENGKDAMALPSNALQGFVLTGNNKEVLFKNGYTSPEHDISSNQLMRLVYDGTVKLLAKETARLHESKDPFTGNVEYKFFSDTNYFLYTADGSFHKIKLKQKDILKTLKDENNDLKNYAKNEGLDFDNEDELAKILSHYDKSKSDS